MTEPYYDDGQVRAASASPETAGKRSAKTQCPAGHLYTPENTYVRPSDGARLCRECGRKRGREAYAARRRERPEVVRGPDYYGLSDPGWIPGESLTDRRRRLEREASRRTRARAKGEDIPPLPRGRRPGYEYTAEHADRISAAVRGANAPHWQGDGVSERGGRARALRLYRDIGPCVRCGATPAERRHVDGNTANNAESNIRVLCRRCHMDEDGRLDLVRRNPGRGISRD